jgi:hypothetical protein
MKDQKPPEKFLAAVFILIIVAFVVLWQILSRDSIPDKASRGDADTGHSVASYIVRPDMPVLSQS